MRALEARNTCSECGAHLLDLRNWIREDAVYAVAPEIAVIHPDEWDLVTLGLRPSVWFAKQLADVLVQPANVWLRER